MRLSNMSETTEKEITEINGGEGKVVKYWGRVTGLGGHQRQRGGH